MTFCRSHLVSGSASALSYSVGEKGVPASAHTLTEEITQGVCDIRRRRSTAYLKILPGTEGLGICCLYTLTQSFRTFPCFILNFPKRPKFRSCSGDYVVCLGLILAFFTASVESFLGYTTCPFALQLPNFCPCCPHLCTFMPFEKIPLLSC